MFNSFFVSFEKLSVTIWRKRGEIMVKSVQQKINLKKMLIFKCGKIFLTKIKFLPF